MSSSQILDAYNNISLVDLTVPSGITNISAYEFWHCSGLSSIVLPDSVTSIGKVAFSNCTSLTSINIPNGVTSIETNTFNACTNLTSINIPSSVTSIGTYAFYNCSSLATLTLTSNIMYINDFAFYGCSNLVLTMEGETPPTVGLNFAGPTVCLNPAGVANFSSSYIKQIRVPASALSAYQSATNWSTYASIMIGY